MYLYSYITHISLIILTLPPPVSSYTGSVNVKCPVKLIHAIDDEEVGQNYDPWIYTIYTL